MIICVGAIFAFACVFLTKEFKKGKLYFIIASGIILFLYSALRGVLPGTDMMGYIRKYDLYAGYSFKRILGIFDSGVKNPVFHFTGWILSKIGFANPQWWIAFIAAAYLIPVIVIIYRESTQPIISIIMFSLLGFFTFSFTGLRQTLAMSLIYISYFYLKSKKPFKFIIFVLLASLFHTTALIFLIAYPLARRRLGLIHILVFGASLLAIALFQGQIRNFIAITLEDSYLAGYADREQGLNLVGFFIQGMIFLVSLIYYSNTVKAHPDSVILYNLAFLGLIFQYASTMIAELFRISMFFSFFNILLLPMAISTERNERIRILESVGCGIVFLMYFFRNGIPQYIFFWQ
jgi:hypothetical protein